MKFAELLNALLLAKGGTKSVRKEWRKTRNGNKLDRAMSRHGNVYGHRWGTK